MASYKKIDTAIKEYLICLSSLQNLGIMPLKKDFTSQIGEWFVAELYGGSKAVSATQKDWDIKLNRTYIQVKTHSKSIGNSARWTAIKHNEGANINFLITVVFTPDYKLKEFYRTPWKDALKLIKRGNGRDIISWDDQKKFRVDLDNLPNQKVVSLFR